MSGICLPSAYLDQTELHSFSSLHLAEMYPNVPLQSHTNTSYVYYGYLIHVDHMNLSADIFKGSKINYYTTKAVCAVIQINVHLQHLIKNAAQVHLKVFFIYTVASQSETMTV